VNTSAVILLMAMMSAFLLVQQVLGESQDREHPEPVAAFAVSYELVEADATWWSHGESEVMSGGLVTYARLCDGGTVIVHGQTNFAWDGERHVYDGASDSYWITLIREDEFAFTYPMRLRDTSMPMMRREASDSPMPLVASQPALPIRFLTAYWDGRQTVMPADLWMDALVEDVEAGVKKEVVAIPLDEDYTLTFRRTLESSTRKPLSLRVAQEGNGSSIIYEYELSNPIHWNGLWIPESVIVLGKMGGRTTTRMVFEFRDLLDDENEIVERFFPTEHDVVTVTEAISGHQGDESQTTRAGKSRAELLELFCPPKDQASSTSP